MNGAVRTSGGADPAAAIRAIWNSNRDEVMGRVAVLEDAVAAMVEGRLSTEGGAAAERDAHKLAGAAGTFGFGRASEAARKLEEILAGTYPVSLDRTLLAATEVVALRADLTRDPAPAAESAIEGPWEPRPAIAPGHAAPAGTRHGPPGGPLLAIAVGGRVRRKELVAAANERGFQALAIGAHAGLPPQDPPCHAALIDLGGGAASLGLMKHLAALDPPVPALALVPSNGPCDRAAAARAGARGFLRAEASAGEIFGAVRDLLAPTLAAECTVLVLDHGPAGPSPVGAVLRNAGLGVVELRDPAQFWEVLREAQPDLVVLGAGMPGSGGAELCRVLRGDATWAALPVLMLSPDDDAGSSAALFDAGADDVVARASIGTDLAGRVLNRLKRTRVLFAAANRDRDREVLGAVPSSTPEPGTAAAAYDVDVVVVDDDPLLAELLGHALATRGYRFRLFTDGQAAAAELAGSRPALRSRVVLLDVDLPVLSGLAVLRKMAFTDNLATTRVIMLTAHSGETEIVNALELGAFDHVAKPFSVPVLMQRVRRALED